MCLVVKHVSKRYLNLTIIPLTYVGWEQLDALAVKLVFAKLLRVNDDEESVQGCFSLVCSLRSCVLAVP